MRFKILLLVFFLNLSINLYSNELVEESKIHKNLRCLVCQGQSIADSNSDFALTLKMVVKDLIKQGKTEEEIYTFLSDKYGDWILYKPKLNPGNLLLWGLPYLALIIGAVIIVFLVRKSSKKA
jgi:cytochrome c-type biogenesis protein CcmH|tara:strand:+ start:126 stop:494 length:369 start_codon:yes stop_codon:yes gene_type:complete